MNLQAAMIVLPHLVGTDSAKGLPEAKNTSALRGGTERTPVFGVRQPSGAFGPPHLQDQV
jgi:hypothetical protein